MWVASKAVYGKMRSFGSPVFFDGLSDSATIPKLITADVITAIVADFKTKSTAWNMTQQRENTALLQQHCRVWNVT